MIDFRELLEGWFIVPGSFSWGKAHRVYRAPNKYHSDLVQTLCGIHSEALRFLRKTEDVAMQCKLCVRRLRRKDN